MNAFEKKKKQQQQCESTEGHYRICKGNHKPVENEFWNFFKCALNIYETWDVLLHKEVAVLSKELKRTTQNLQMDPIIECENIVFVMQWSSFGEVYLPEHFVSQTSGEKMSKIHILLFFLFPFRLVFWEFSQILPFKTLNI